MDNAKLPVSETVVVIDGLLPNTIPDSTISQLVLTPELMSTEYTTTGIVILFNTFTEGFRIINIAANFLDVVIAWLKLEHIIFAGDGHDLHPSWNLQFIDEISYAYKSNVGPLSEV